jgi:3-hydroxyisobutyrate dehydrogenase-like beta-hydroxyacid dehydrogenase
MSNDRIGFIGLGDMGYPMARRLLKHGFAVISCANRRREVIETRDGLIEKDNLRTVAAIADILITIVVDEIQTDAVLRGPSGALLSMKSGSVLILMSTLAPTYCKKIAALAAAQGITVLDCPVSEGTIGAEKGTLALIGGDDVDAMERARTAPEVLCLVPSGESLSRCIK